MNYLLDTNILVIYGRANELSEAVENKYKIFNAGNSLSISVVTLGELDALSKKLNLGRVRRENMRNLVDRLTVADIHYTEVLEAYGDIDQFSQGKTQIAVDKQRFSAKNMGKNDIWIAATAHVFGLTLVTTDKDFDHLNGNFLSVLYVDMEEIKEIVKTS